MRGLWAPALVCLPSAAGLSARLFRLGGSRQPGFLSRRDGHGVVVDWELVDLGRLAEREVTEVCAGWHEPTLNELIEVCAVVPEVDYAPASVDRAGRVEDQPARWPVLDVEVVVDCGVLLLGTAGELQPESDGHHRSSRWVRRRAYPHSRRREQAKAGGVGSSATRLATHWPSPDKYRRSGRSLRMQSARRRMQIRRFSSGPGSLGLPFVLGSARRTSRARKRPPPSAAAAS